MQIIPIRDLKDTVKIETLCSQTNGPVFITKNGYGKLVVMDIDYYEKTMQKISEANLVNSGLDDIENNNTKPSAAVLDSLKQKYDL